ncbi:NmrA family NAD(P)-binding protein [Bradyrhizobium sp.]|uniref:NmrA family NAD(P)-binding protein n=1 Tax=Bradyrhizobium sp. TaxID=376 RepID=UPI0023A02E86|nr:NmrA family NAD(P)-binding protein [Bradyrhizobium sp.]MDE1933576.1 NmrA family NAD(P)-binding protein [Bradyrhizobium sp.]
MVHPTILVTGATGKIGGAVASLLLQLGWPVRALVHRQDARSEDLRSRGADVAVADLFDPQQLQEAMRGTSRAFYCPPWHPYMIQSAAAFAVAARLAGLEAVVGLSQWLAAPDHPSLATRQNWLVDHLFAMLPGAAHVIVNPGFFADNYLRLVPFAAQLGLFPMPTGTSRNAPPSNEDIARVTAAALMRPDRHNGRSYRPTGPELLSAADMADILQRVLQRRVRHMEIPLWMFIKAARALGLSIYELTNVRRYIEEHRKGAFEIGAPTDHVLEVTGRAPESFETIARHYAARPEAGRTLAHKWRAIGDFARIGFTTVQDLDRYERDQQYPLLDQAHLAVDSREWRMEHAPANSLAMPSPKGAVRA